MDIRGLKETVKMRWKKVGQTKADLDLKSWNKILRSGGRPAPVLKYLHSMVFVAAAGQVDKHASFKGSDFYGEGRQLKLFSL